MQNELIEFTDEQNLEVFGNGKDITSKIRSLRRLIQRGLLPKPKWEGGKLPAFWENDSEIKDRVIWIDEKRKERLSYRQMREELESEKIPRPESLIASDLLYYIEELLNIKPGCLEVLFIKAMIMYRLGKREEALKILLNLEANCKENKGLLFIVYDKIILVYHNLNNKEMELKTCQKFISLAEEMGDNKMLGSAYCHLGNCIRYTEMDKAFDYFQSSIELLKGSDLLGLAYANISWVLEQKANFSKAEEYLKKSIELFFESNDKKDETTCKANLGFLYYKTNRLSEAMKLMQEAYHSFSQIQDLDGEAATIGNIGRIYLKRGLFSKAIEHFRHAYHIVSKIKNPRAQKVWLQRMSEVYKAMGNLKKSEFFLKESKKIKEQPNIRKGDS